MKTNDAGSNDGRIIKPWQRRDKATFEMKFFFGADALTNSRETFHLVHTSSVNRS